MLAELSRPINVVAKQSSLALEVDGAALEGLVEQLPALRVVLSIRMVKRVPVEEVLLLEPASTALREHMEMEHAAESWHFLKEQGKFPLFD